MDDVDQVLEELIAGRDDARRRLEAALGDDDVGKLLGEVDVRGFERARADGATATGVRRADDGVAGVRGRDPVVLPGALQAAWVDEVGERELADDTVRAVRVDATDFAAAGDGEA